MEFYKLELKEIYKSLESSENGLGEKEAKSRLEKFGYNKLEAKKKISPFLIFLGEFNDPVVAIVGPGAIYLYLLGNAPLSFASMGKLWLSLLLCLWDLFWLFLLLIFFFPKSLSRISLMLSLPLFRTLTAGSLMEALREHH